MIISDNNLISLPNTVDKLINLREIVIIEKLENISNSINRLKELRF